MNNLVANYKIILNNLRITCGDIDSFSQIRNPKLSNIELVSLYLTAEYMSINTELQLFRFLKGTYLERMLSEVFIIKGEGNYLIIPNPLENELAKCLQHSQMSL